LLLLLFIVVVVCGCFLWFGYCVCHQAGNTVSVLCFSHQLSSSHWKCLNKLRVTFTTSQCSLAYKFTQVDQNNGITLSPCFWSMDN
jgi:hypothetical protein